MAKSSIRGITIQVGGDTTELKKALAGVNGDARNLQSEMKQVERLTKLDPSSTVLLTQKQKLLSEEIANTKDKLSQLKSAQSQVEEQFKNGDIGEEQYRAFQREIVETENKLKDLEKQARQSGSVLGTQLQNAGSKMESTGKKISDAGQKLLPVTATVAGIGAASVKTAADFETSLSQTAGALDIPISKMENLRKLALKMGADTQFSAEEAGQAMTELAKGGLSEADIEGGALKSTMDLAASSSMDLGTAANTVVQVMGAFGLKAKDSAQAVNALAGAAAASSTDVEPLSQGLSQCAAQAHTAGWSIQQTTAVLGAFADAGITGSDAGTSLKTMLQRLGAPTDTAAKEIKSLGLNIWTSSGHMKDASGIAQELQKKLGSLSDKQKQQALSTIFGSDATRAATVLMNDGVSGLSKYIKATNDQTAAQRLANSQMGNSTKTWEQMKGSLETAAIQIGTAILPTINKIVQGVTNLTNKFSSLSPKMQDIVIKAALIVGALAPVIITIGKMTTGIGAITKGIGKTITAVSDFHKALSGGASLAKALSAALTPAGAVIAAVVAITAAVALLVVGIKHLYDTNANFRNAVNTIWNSIKSTLQTIANWFSGSFLPMLQKAPEQIKTFFTGLPSFFNSLLNQIKINVSNTINEIKTTVSNIANTIFNTVKTKLNQLNITLQKHATQIKVVAGILGTVFGPALIKSGIQAVTAGSKIASGFIVNLVKTGAQAAITGAKLTANFVASMIKSGAEAVINGAKITASFVTSMIQSGAQAVVNGAKLTASFTASMIEAGAQAVINGAKVVSSFIASMIQAAAQAITTGAAITGNLIAAIVAYAASGWKAVAAITAQTTAWVAQKAVTIASTVATKAATAAQWLFNAALNANPIGIVITAITALVGALVILYNKNKTFRDFINNMWSNIKTGWMNVINGIESAWDSLNPLQWGKDFMDGLINGIKSKIEDIKNAVKNVANTIHSHLHFSRPDEGPLADYETWMPDFMSGLAEGITNNIFKVKNAVSQVASSMVNAVPTDLSLNIGASINGINGLRTAYASAQSVSTSTYNTPINIKMGDITVQGNADQNALVQMKQIAQDQVDQLEQHLIYAFTILPSKARAKVK